MHIIDEFWGEPISVYTRAQALDDGVLVDVSTVAREAGFRYPVAITQALEAVIASQGEYNGRLWDVLWMASLAARRGSEQITFSLILPYHRATMATLKMVCGPGDEGEPVITIMLPEED